MTPFKSLSLTVALAATCATTLWAGGHEQTPEQQAMSARGAHMTLYGFNIGVLGAMAQDKMPYDAAMASAAAANLAAVANMDQSRYWVPGTDSAAVEDSRLKPEALANLADFNAKAAALATASTALAAAAGTDLDALKAAFGPVGGACGDCHRTYRVSNN